MEELKVEVCFVLSEMEMKNREEELNAIVSDLRKENDSLREKVAKEEFEKLVRTSS